MKNLLVLLLITISYFAYSQDRASDSIALLNIYNNFDGANWTNADNWASDKPITEWKGVILSQERVRSLSLKLFNAKGPFPSNIIDLTELKTLEISNAEITGNIPTNLVQLTKLSTLSLDNCKLKGEVPNIFTQFENLNYLILRNNELTGSLPDLGDDLTLFYAGRNQFSGPIPQSWANNPLGNISLEYNNLSGTLDIFGTWPNLSKLDVDNNDWDAQPLPDWLDDNGKIQRFSCSNCNLTGDIPSDLDMSNIETYKAMHVSENNLSGDISLLFNNPDHNQSLYLRANSNNFSGEFPCHKVPTNIFSLQVKDNGYDSMTEFGDVLVKVFDFRYNHMNYEDLEPLKYYIDTDTIIGIVYDRQEKLLTQDTIHISAPTSLTIYAGDNHPSTTYEWKHRSVAIDNIIAELAIDISDNTSSGSYSCAMKNDRFPDLNLSRNEVVIMVDITTGTSDLLTEQLYIFPNPTTGFFSINTSEDIEDSSYQIISMNGKVVSSGFINNQTEVDIQHIPKGSYHLNIIGKTRIINARIVKL